MGKGIRCRKRPQDLKKGCSWQIEKKKSGGRHCLGGGGEKVGIKASLLKTQEKRGGCRGGGNCESSHKVVQKKKIKPLSSGGRGKSRSVGDHTL